MIPRLRLKAPPPRPYLSLSLPPPPQPRPYSSSTSPQTSLETHLSNPTWSVKALFNPITTPSETITPHHLHHLLRLSALPLPKTPLEETNLLSDLTAHLHFVRAIQAVDTEGVEPLVVVKDESEEGEIGLEEMKGELAGEEVVGMRGRIVRRKREESGEEGEGGGGGGGMDLLAQAPRRLGPYVVVDTAKD